MKKEIPATAGDDSSEPPLLENKKNNFQDSDWKEIIQHSLCSAEQIANFFGLPVETLQTVCQHYPAKINPYYLSLIKNKDDAIYKQCVPASEEITDQTGENDPLCEEPEHQTRTKVPALITHRYPDRVLFLISNQCAMYCRFCTRKRKVGDPTKQPTWTEIEQALAYIKKHEEIRDVILSGGDPLMLDDALLEKIIKEVFKIVSQRNNGIIRIGSRIPCALPQRITPALCDILKKYQPLYLNTHFNHPDEITPESTRACTRLADAGVPLACQTVLLKGVNDRPEIMGELLKKLIHIRVRPYYIYQADPVKGTNHFRTRVEHGLEIYRSLRGFISGLCIPYYVIDAPGGGGKIPLLPEYVIDCQPDKIILKNYEGKKFVYPQIKK